MAVPIVSIFDSGQYEKLVQRGAQTLSVGGIVVLPTETVYGAAALLSHPGGVKRLRALRGESTAPFTIHVAHPDDATVYVDELSDFQRRLVRKLWPGPIGLLFNVSAARREKVAKAMGFTASDVYEAQGNITLRCPDHVVATDVISEVDGPVALTAAGTGGSGSSWKPEPLAAELDGKADLIFDAGPTKYSKPSTLLKVSENKYEIVRAGVYDERIIERLLRTTILFVCSGNTCRSPMAEAIARHILAEQLEVAEPELERKG